MLTPERHDELAALLDDENRFTADFPKVAEYLSMASVLPGTGQEAADAAFDLRFLHYMTGGESDSGNPYWDIVAPSVSTREGWRVVDGGVPKGSARLGFAQMILQATYAYAIPSPETLRWIVAACEGRTLVEIGAGRGYWAHQIARLGVDVTAYDSEPPGDVANVSFPEAAGQRAVWHHVGGPADVSASRPGVGQVLFLCWPPGWGNPMSSQALLDFERTGGRRLIYIGEDRGGKTGDDAYFDALADRWELTGHDDAFVSWWNLADVAQCWDFKG